MAHQHQLFALEGNTSCPLAERQDRDRVVLDGHRQVEPEVSVPFLFVLLLFVFPFAPRRLPLAFVAGSFLVLLFFFFLLLPVLRLCGLSVLDPFLLGLHVFADQVGVLHPHAPTRHHLAARLHVRLARGQLVDLVLVETHRGTHRQLVAVCQKHGPAPHVEAARHDLEEASRELEAVVGGERGLDRFVGEQQAARDLGEVVVGLLELAPELGFARGFRVQGGAWFHVTPTGRCAGSARATGPNAKPGCDWGSRPRPDP